MNKNGRHRTASANEPGTYDDSTCDVQWARQVVHPLARAWAFAHSNLAPKFLVSQNDTHFGSARTDEKERQTGQRQIAATVQGFFTIRLMIEATHLRVFWVGRICVVDQTILPPSWNSFVGTGIQDGPMPPA